MRRAHVSRHWLIRILAGVLGLLILYRLAYPTGNTVVGVAVVIGVTAVLSVLWERHVPRDLTDAGTDWRMTLITTLVSGLLVLLAVYAAAYGIMAAAYLIPDVGIIGQLLFELLQHLRQLQTFPLETVLLGYLVGAFFMATGVWLLYPFVRIRQHRLRLIVTFLAAWIYTLAIVSFALPVLYAWEPTMLLVDAVFVAFWALTFLNTRPVLQGRLDHH